MDKSTPPGLPGNFCQTHIKTTSFRPKATIRADTSARKRFTIQGHPAMHGKKIACSMLFKDWLVSRIRARYYGRELRKVHVGRLECRDVQSISRRPENLT